jgi:hypothetical protein
MYYYTSLLITVSLQLATRHFGKYLVALGTNLFFWEAHLGVFGASPRSFGWHLGGPRSRPLSLCDAPPNLGESLAGGALLGRHPSSVAGWTCVRHVGLNTSACSRDFFAHAACRRGEVYDGLSCLVVCYVLLRPIVLYCRNRSCFILGCDCPRRHARVNKWCIYCIHSSPTNYSVEIHTPIALCKHTILLL